MRYLLILGTVASALLWGASQVKAGEEVHFATAAAATTNASANLQDWRYRWHNGQWWYWTPSNYWMTYNNGAWSRYNAAVAANVLGARVGANVGIGPYGYRNPYYGNYGRYYGGYRGYPYYGYRGGYYGGYRGGYYGPAYRGYGPGGAAGVAGRAAVRALIR